MSKRRGPKALTAVVMAGLAVTAVGCTSSPDPTVPSTPVSAAPTVAVSIPPAPIPGKGGVEGAAEDLTGKTCEFASGAWNFTGTLKNSTKKVQTYSVRISVRNPETSSVINAVVLESKLEPGKSEKLDKPAVISTPDAVGLDCVVNVTRKAS